MTTGKLTEGRRMDCEDENAKLLAEFEKDLVVGGRSPHTIIAYRVAAKDFFKFTLGLDIRQATHRDIREWLHWLTVQGCNSQTLSQKKYVLAAFFQFLKKIDEVKD